MITKICNLVQFGAQKTCNLVQFRALKICKCNKVTELIQVTYDFSQPKTKLYNREIGGLLKGSADTGCKNLTLVMMTGEEGDIQVEELTIHKVLACHWLV